MTAVLIVDVKLSDLVNDAEDILNENKQEDNDVFFGFVSFGEICCFYTDYTGINRKVFIELIVEFDFGGPYIKLRIANFKRKEK